MGRKSKASQARLNNLRNCAPKPYHPTVEDVSDTEDMDYMPRDDLDLVSEADVEEGERDCNEFQEKIYVPADASDGDDMSATDYSDLEDMELDDDEEADIINDAALLAFSSVLQRAQDIATAAENKKWGERKRPKRYAKNSTRTLRRHAQKRRKLATEGQRPISDWVQPMQQLEPPTTSMTSSADKTPAKTSPVSSYSH